MKILYSLLILLLLSIGVSAEPQLTMQQILDISIERDFSLKSADYELDISKQDYYYSKSLRYPSLSLSAVSFYNSETAVIDIPVMNQSIETGSNDNYQIDLKMSVPLFTGGKLTNQIKMGKERLNASQYNYQAQKMRLAYKVRQAFLSYLTSRKMYQSSVASLSRIEIVLNDIKNLYKNGMADSLDVLEAELARVNVNEAIIKTKTAVEQSSILLKKYLGWQSEKELNIVDSLNWPEFDNAIPNESNNRAELMIYKHNIQALEKMTSLKKAGYFPDISAYIGYSYGMPNKQMVDPQWNDNYIAGIGLNWSLNLGGATGHSVSSARAQMESVKMAQEELTESLIFQKNIALEKINEAVENINIDYQKYDIAREKYRLAREKHNQGTISVNRLLEIETELTSAEKIYQSAIINYYLAENEYFYAVGSPKIFGGIEND
ncbi:MAG: TolC family protein [Candidatus Zixiibacteriota bacterium]